MPRTGAGWSNRQWVRIWPTPRWLLNAGFSYWRERNQGVDFIVRGANRLIAIGVKSDRSAQAHAGMAAFANQFKPDRSPHVGGDGIPVEEFLLQPVAHWRR